MLMEEIKNYAILFIYLASFQWKIAYLFYIIKLLGNTYYLKVTVSQWFLNKDLLDRTISTGKLGGF